MSIVEVNCEDLESNPSCAHGPTLKFSRQVKGKVRSFYACSACRDRKECPFYLWEGEKITESKLLAWKDWKEKTIPVINHDTILKRLSSFKKLGNERQFCLSCFDFVLANEVAKHSGHVVKKHITNDMLNHPSKILAPLSNNKKEAQFWFSDNSKQFIVGNILNLDINNVICLGSPTIHEILRTKKIKSILMDIDHRYHWFYDSEEFCWFNMFNFYFMENKVISEDVLSVLKSSDVLFVIDPPFGARIEPLKKTIDKFMNLTSHRINIVLILPYFMEPQVISIFSNFTMLDYPIEYTNHLKFKNKVSKKPSPVRVFTNVVPSKFLHPKNEGFYFCDLCKMWRNVINKHCSLCKTCPSKNGDLYKHCSVCNVCVKQTWTHCNNCRKCCLSEHSCGNNKPSLSSFNFKRRK